MMSSRLRIYRFSGVLALIPILLSGMGSARAETLTLDDSIKIALQNNPAVRIARENISVADSSITQAASQGMPKITLNGTYQRLDKVNTAEFGGNTIELGSIDNRSANLTLTQPIDIFGIVGAGTKVAKYTKTSSQQGLSRAIYDITLQTKQAYYNVLRAQSLVKVQEDTVAQLEAHLRDTQIRKDAGDATNFEVLRAQTAAASAKKDLLSAQNGLQLANAAFNNVLVRPLETPVELAQPDEPKFYQLDMPGCLDCALKNSPDLQQAATAVKINEGVAKVTKKAGLPRFNLNWTANRNFDTSLFNSRENSWTAYLTGSVNLFDGGATRSAVEIANSNAENSKSNLQSVHDAILLQAKQAYLDVSSNKERIDAAKLALDTARESMRLADVRYKGGVSTQLEILDAQQALTAASTGYVMAVYDYQDSLARLERVMGGPAVFLQFVSNPQAQPGTQQAAK